MPLNIKAVSGNIGAGNTSRLMNYLTDDDRATVEGAGYFNEMYLTVKENDTILVNSSDELFQVIVKEADIVAQTVTTQTTMSEGGL